MDSSIFNQSKEDSKKNEEGSLQQYLLETRSLLLTGEVNKELCQKINRQLLSLEHHNKESPIYVFIDSPGGDVDAGYAIFDMIRFIAPPVYTVGMGLVASAGSLILLAAQSQRRLAFPNSHYLIHQPLSGMRGVATAIEIHAREVEKLRQRINQLISNETKRPVEQVARDTDRDYWMSAEEALEYGLISRVVSNREEMPR